MKLLLDEMWAPAIAEALRDRGHEVVAVAERRDLRGMPDAAIFDAARAECWVIVTENVVDYRPLAAAAMRAGLLPTNLRQIVERVTLHRCVDAFQVKHAAALPGGRFSNALTPNDNRTSGHRPAFTTRAPVPTCLPKFTRC